MTHAKIGRFTTPADQARFEAVYDEAMRTLPPPAETHDLQTPFGHVRVYRFGQTAGTPVVLLHGRAATTVVWQPNIPALAERRPVYAMDLLGEGGRSMQTAPITGSDDQAAWLASVLEQLGIAAAHFVGHSIGGWATCNQAVRAPQRLASISLLEPINTLAPIAFGVVLRSIPALLPVTGRWALPRFIRWIGGQDRLPQDDPIVNVISANLQCYRTALPAPAYITDSELRSISVPTLALIGGRSVVHDPDRCLRRAQTLIPNVQAELWPEATHSITTEDPGKVNTRILRFIDDIDG
jgi:pimeloyl-ACP methyl ester carboxylesterase